MTASQDPYPPFPQSAAPWIGPPLQGLPPPGAVRPARRTFWWIAALAAGAVVLVGGGSAALVGAAVWSNRQVDPVGLAGDWMTMNVRYSILVQGGTPQLIGVVDEDDGERFVVESCAWDGATLSWVLYVPSSGSRIQESLYPTRSGLAVGAVHGRFTTIHADGTTNVGASVFTRRP
jgi:hypothetical protein